MRSERAWFLRLFALVSVLALVLAACGGDDDDDDAGGEGDDTTEETGEEPEGEAGGEFIDGGTFVGDPPEHIDPALNMTLDAYQVVNALYDGLTEIDGTDPASPEIVGLVAESWESNDEATVWTFTIKDGLTFSDGEEVLPSSFVRGWERASNPDFAGDYSYLFNFIEGGAEKLDGTADEPFGCRCRRRGDDPDDNAFGAVLELAGSRGLPAVLPDAVGRRRPRRPERVGERAHDRQRAVHARVAADRHRDRRREEPRVGRRHLR